MKPSAVAAPLRLAGFLATMIATVTIATMLIAVASPAYAAILITVDKTTQRMTVEMTGHELYNRPVSTGKPGYDTPSGSFRAFRMEADHFSKEWDDAPMPHSIFFTQKGHAIHGTFDAKRLGHAVSHGCVRLSTDHARLLFGLVKQDGVLNTRVVLTGDTPASSAPVASSRRAPRIAERQAGFDDSSDPSWWQDQQARDQRTWDRRTWDQQTRAPARMRDQRYRTRPSRDDYVESRRYYRYGEEIAPRRYEYPDAPGRLYEQPRGDWGWR
jgi:hypothetical protein